MTKYPKTPTSVFASTLSSGILYSQIHGKRLETMQAATKTTTSTTYCVIALHYITFFRWFLLLLSSYGRPMEYGSPLYLLGKEAVTSPSIGNTLWRISTMFVHPAITQPEVNGFG